MLKFRRDYNLVDRYAILKLQIRQTYHFSSSPLMGTFIPIAGFNVISISF